MSILNGSQMEPTMNKTLKVILLLGVGAACAPPSTPNEAGQSKQAVGTSGSQSADCYLRSKEISQRVGEVVTNTDRSCLKDEDCKLVSSDLPCLTTCRVAVNAAAEGALREALESVSTACDATCKSAFDCLQEPQVARCRSGRCKGERLPTE